MRNGLMLLLNVSLLWQISAQPDTMVVYDLYTHQISYILPVPYDSTISSDHTPSFQGSMAGTVALSTNPPTQNLFSGSQFCDLQRAEDVFDLGKYPVRTTVAFRSMDSGVYKPVCSGMLVSPNFVISVAHCVFDMSSKTFQYTDSLKAIPAYNNGLPHPQLYSSRVRRIFLFKAYFSGTSWEDVALMELETPIGNQTGYIGMGFDNNISTTPNKVYHKFSYPSIDSPWDPNKKYNGDTLYYNYGAISEISTWLGVISLQANGIPGQSGSSLIYTDNQDYYTVGLFAFSSNYLHYRITPKVFYQLKHVMDINVVGLQEAKSEILTYQLYPNPFTDKLNLEFPGGKPSKFEMLNLLGQQIILPYSYTSKGIEINTSQLTSGIYLCNLEDEKGNRRSVKLIKP